MEIKNENTKKAFAVIQYSIDIFDENDFMHRARSQVFGME